ncbi:hypothetical protein CH275_09615 [Rhodococcus sp. 06-235-1A]|uniref:SAM-dependent methyltransferase n=1 Tax=Rhodococcus sp. 06-235-1A TaxID=2022508 RepID=UPI000B9A7CBE|nr:SAM-dependent methyltransferase [Rhodococcus sp. 06-235-1A]OZD06467.1 hypothetical protein CH275_09615 [Rhodococcus sp. 06-235-1A]
MNTPEPVHASAARMYDYYLGGTHNFTVDRQRAEEVIALLPITPTIMRANRQFLRRAVRFCAEQGVDQFLDLGAGIPTEGPVHEVVGEVTPDYRVLYVDSEEAAAVYGRQILGSDPRCAFLHADICDIDAVLDSPEANKVLDLSRPVAVLLFSVLQFVPDAADPWGVVAAYRDRLADGSYLALSHATAEGLAAQSGDVTAVYSKTDNPIRYRSDDAVRAMFEGFNLVEPGMTRIPEWRMPGKESDERYVGKVFGLAGVGVKDGTASGAMRGARGRVRR